MVILDELCSGTNPSEGVEVFALVLRLLRKVRPTALLTTHFLDFARSLAEAPIVSGLEFCQVEVDERQLSTYQFIPGVAETSLAALTATRLGVTFERLSSMIEAHGAEPEEEPAAARSGASGASS
jgi:DNA mismatch repair protein MutS2